MPSKRHASVAATLIALTSAVVVGGQQSTPREADRDTFVEILSAPDDTGWTLGVNGGCNPEDPRLAAAITIDDV